MRILQELAIETQLAKAIGFRGYDPVEDTARDASLVRNGLDDRFRGYDPVEDTASLYLSSVLYMHVPVSGATIRLRILQD